MNRTIPEDKEYRWYMEKKGFWEEAAKGEEQQLWPRAGLVGN